VADLEGAGNTLNRGSRRLASPETGIPLSAVITLGACCDAVAGRFWRRTGHRGGWVKNHFFRRPVGAECQGLGRELDPSSRYIPPFKIPLRFLPPVTNRCKAPKPLGIKAKALSTYNHTFKEVE
jgi:hypothetical protein